MLRQQPVRGVSTRIAAESYLPFESSPGQRRVARASGRFRVRGYYSASLPGAIEVGGSRLLAIVAMADLT